MEQVFGTIASILLLAIITFTLIIWADLRKQEREIRAIDWNNHKAKQK